MEGAYISVPALNVFSVVGRQPRDNGLIFMKKVSPELAALGGGTLTETALRLGSFCLRRDEFSAGKWK